MFCHRGSTIVSNIASIATQSKPGEGTGVGIVLGEGGGDKGRDESHRSAGRSRDEWLLRLRRSWHRREAGAANEIHKTLQVCRLLVAAPGNMLVRTHQHEPVAIERQRLARSHVENGKG
jgi:hypothetical protein